MQAFKLQLSAIVAANVRIIIGASHTLRSSAQKASGEEIATMTTAAHTKRTFTVARFALSHIDTGISIATSRNGHANG